MDKYIVISIIIVLYFVQKYCIKSEVETFLLTKSILEKFDETTGGLNILGNIKLASRHIISSELTGLAIYAAGATRTNLDYGNLKVKDITVTGSLIQSGSSNLPSSFTNNSRTAKLNINSGALLNSVDITSVNGPLILSGQNGPVTLAGQNIVKIDGNIDITGNVTFNTAKPIVTRIVIIPSNSTSATPTYISAIDYPSITFSGFDNSTASIQTYAAAIEFNTSKGPDNKWYISFTPTPSSIINVRLTFFHKNLVQNNEPMDAIGLRDGNLVYYSWLPPSIGASPITKYRITQEALRLDGGFDLQDPINVNVTDPRYSEISGRVQVAMPWDVAANPWQYYRFKVAAFNDAGYTNDSAYSNNFTL